MKNVDEWSGLSALLSNLIAKYADVLDLDSMPNPEPSSENTALSNTAKNSVARTKVA